MRSRLWYFLFFVLTLGISQAAEWQWSVEVPNVVSSETSAPPRAFLWIPPNCQQVRAVIVGQHNMEEEPILEHPKFRQAMSELGIAEIWVTPAIDLFFRFDQGAGEKFDGMMKALAEVSGYQELEFEPIVPIGHSAAASFPWNFAAWNPKRTLAVISMSGQWPYYKDTNTPDWGDRSIDGIPGLVSIGEYEWANDRAGEGLKERADHPQCPLSMLANPAAGHFDFSDEKIDFLALYLKKAVQYRLPDNAPLDGPVELKPIDPAKQGWLVDRWRMNQAPKAAAAPVGHYKGPVNEAFWAFDEEIAKVTEQFGANYRGKKADLLGFVQDGAVVPQTPGAHLQVNLKFAPEDDGVTFKLTGAFLDTVPEGRPEKWTGLPKGSMIEHSNSTDPITITRICGPVVQLAPDTFSVRFYRMGMNNGKRSGDIYFFASHPGDDQYKRAVQQAQMHIPTKNTVGKDQHITFPKIPDQAEGTASVPLNATSSANVPVYYYVREGPAEIDNDNTLRFTQIPPRSKFPVKVTVVAWQLGRSTEPKLKSAEPVEQTFSITK